MLSSLLPVRFSLALRRWAGGGSGPKKPSTDAEVEEATSLPKEGGAAVSRSTSPGCSSERSQAGGHDKSPPKSPSCSQGTSPVAPKARGCGLPEIDYPLPVFVQNTFLHAEIGRSPSFDVFFQDREAKSCPASALFSAPCAEASLQKEESDDASTEEGKDEEALSPLPTPQLRRWPSTMSSEELEAFIRPQPFQQEWPSRPAPMGPVPTPTVPMTHGCGLSLPIPPPPPLGQAPILAPPVEPPPPVGAATATPLGLSQAILLEEEMLAAQWPNVGSKGHAFGNCKPCAFLHTKGCVNGVACDFCHLCDAGEKKRRQKVRRAIHHKAFGDVGAESWQEQEPVWSQQDVYAGGAFLEQSHPAAPQVANGPPSN